MRRVEVAVVGGGPAGLAAAIEARRRGLSVAVLERQRYPVDKACGEGLMPAGVAALGRLGALAHLDREGCAPFTAIRWQQEDGRFADAPLPAPGGLGVRRTALSAALAARAREVGAALLEGAGLRTHQLGPDGVRLGTDQGEVRSELLVVADGLQSPLRRALGLHLEAGGPRRYGLRRHLALTPWAPRVEVHYAPGVEAYLTPAGPRRLGVAFLYQPGVVGEPVRYEGLLARFPALQERLAGAPADSETRGAGPLRQAVRTRALDRVVLLGDAAGYLDAITGEGLSLAFEGAEALGACLPDALARGGAAEAFAPYQRTAAAAFTRYARLAGALVWVASRPALRRAVLGRLAAHPGLFGWGLERFLGSAGLALAPLPAT